MRRYFLFALGASMLSGAATTQAADWWERAYHSVKRDWHRNNAWYEPFNYADRDAVYAPFGVMVDNGWRLQNTLGAHHFDENTNQLTPAGQLKVQWILTEALPQHRSISVERGATNLATQTRIRSVREAAARIVPANEVPAIAETAIPVRGWSGDYINAINSAWQNSIPAPRLPENNGGGGGSGGGSSNQ
jgi:hypothetical protein